MLFRAQDALLQVGAMQQSKMRHGRGRLRACAAESTLASFLPPSGVRPPTPGAWAGRGWGGARPAVNLKTAAADWRAWWALSQLTAFTNHRTQLAKSTSDWSSVTSHHLGRSFRQALRTLLESVDQPPGFRTQVRIRVHGPGQSAGEGRCAQMCV
jgi:hypothetical protein